MSSICCICNKKPHIGFNVSNANNKTKKWIYPNVHVIRYKFKSDSKVKRGAVCTRCVKTGKIEKVI